MWVYRVLVVLMFLLAGSFGAQTVYGDSELKEVNLEFRNPLIRDIKILLKGRGFKPGEINGEDNEKFRAAIKEFEKSQGLEETGEPSFENYQKLLAAEGLGVLKVGDFKTIDGCEVRFRYSKESEVLVIQERCPKDPDLHPVENDDAIAIPGMQIDYVPTPFGQ